MAARITFSTDSSSSEDEEDKARLKEAVFDTQLFITGKDKVDLRSTDENRNLPSKRLDKETNGLDDHNNTLNTTPGFRKHMSRKLSEALDSEIDSRNECFHTSIPDVDQSNGVKLFSNSTKFLLQEDPSKQERIKPVKKRRQSSSSDSSSEDERLTEASVTHDFIMQQSNLPYFANQKPADFVIKQSGSEQSLKVNKVILSDNEKTDSFKSKCEVKTDTVKNDRTDRTELHKMMENRDAQIEENDVQIKASKKKKKKRKKEMH